MRGDEHESRKIVEYQRHECYTAFTMKQRTDLPIPADTTVFYDAFYASPIGIAVENLQGQPLFVNPALCMMLGYTEDEMRHKRCVEFSPPEDAEKDWALFQQLKGGTIDRYQLDKRFYRRDGSLVWGRLSISLLHRRSAFVVAMVEDITERKTAEDTLADLSRKLVEIQEEERTRIARDLHDDINQRLAVLAFEVEQLKQRPPDSSSELSSRLTAMRDRIAEVANGVQSLSKELHSPQLEYLGVGPALKSFCEDFGQRQNVDIRFEGDDIRPSTARDLSLCLLRVLQEALHNACRHSNVRQFEVSFKRIANHLHLTISDRGSGFDSETALNKGGLGLISMRERARLVNGTLVIDSKAGGGTTVRLTVPFRPVTV
jgi:PAS domain S-box-containing protein